MNVKPLSHQSGVLTAFPQRFIKMQNAVQSPRTPCGGVYFGHAQNKRRGLAFAQRVRQNAVATQWQRCDNAVVTLWDLLERHRRAVSAPRARCEDAV